MLEPIIIVCSLLLLLVMSVALVVTITSYNDLFKKFQKDSKVAVKQGRRLRGSQKLVDEETAILKSRLEEVIGEESGEFQKTLEEVKVDAQKIFHEIAEVSKTEVRADLAAFRKALDTNLIQDMQKAKVELDQYKVDKKRELDQKAKLVLQEIAMSVLGVSIDVDKHEELIMKALARAKEDKFF